MCKIWKYEQNEMEYFPTKNPEDDARVIFCLLQN